MWCSQCGGSLGDGARYCSACGAQVHVPSTTSGGTLTGGVTTRRQYRGLRGWLLLVGLGVLISPIYLGFSVYQDAVLFTDGTVRLISTFAPSYSPFLRCELLVLTLACLTWAYILCLYFLKSRLFPRWYIGAQVGMIVWWIVDYAMMKTIADGAGLLKEVMQEQLNTLEPAVFRTVPYAIIWVLYMLKSKRVRATFVE